MTFGAPATLIEFASAESSGADLPGEARGRYVASLGGDSWSVVLGRRWVAVSADGDHKRSRYRVDELDGGTRITTIPTSRDEGPLEAWWLVTGGQRRYLVRDVARVPFCLDVAGSIERGDAHGAWLQQETHLGGSWSEPTGPDWLTNCRVPEGSRWSGTVVPGVPGEVSSADVVFQAPVTDHLFVPYGGAVCGIDDEDLFVTIAIGGPIAHAPTVLALARILTPLPVGTVVELHGGEVVCPERATDAEPEPP